MKSKLLILGFSFLLVNFIYIPASNSTPPIKVCTHGDCSEPCGQCTYDGPNGSLSGGGSLCPPWPSEIDNRRWYNCTGKTPTGPGGLVCINDFVNANKPYTSINCKTMEAVTACCGASYINKVGCAKGPAEKCNCYNCAASQ